MDGPYPLLFCVGYMFASPINVRSCLLNGLTKLSIAFRHIGKELTVVIQIDTGFERRL